MKDKPKEPEDKLKRSECSLMYQLIERNPEKAMAFLRRLRDSMRTP